MTQDRGVKAVRGPGPDEACFAATRGLCNVCGALTEAKIVFRGDRVVLVKWCPDHGMTEGLVSSDRDWYLRSLSYVKPGTRPRERAVSSFVGCPTSCGLCPEHQQHTCVPIIEVTGECDLHCPICLVAGQRAGHLPLEAIQKMVDQLVRCEGKINMLTLSGGEPTLHPDLLRVVEAARRPEIGIISLSTHGLGLLEREDLARELIAREVVISLQFDGTRPETYQALRGRPELAELKRRLVERLLDLGARLSLTVTLARDVNEGELADILGLFFRETQIMSVMVQPLCHAGRARTHFSGDPLRILTIPEVVSLLAASSGGALVPADFTPLPCSHPTCFALTYLLRTGSGALVPLPRLIDPESYLDIIKNQALLGTDTDTLLRVKDALYALWTSDGILPEREEILRAVKTLLLDLNRLGSGACHRDVLALGARNVKSIFIHQFMDRTTFDLSRAMKCCNHYPEADGRLIPACVRNNVKL